MIAISDITDTLGWWIAGVAVFLAITVVLPLIFSVIRIWRQSHE